MKLTHEIIAELMPSERPMAREIAKRGLIATYNGNAWHVRGPGVDVLACRLRYIAVVDLKPNVALKHQQDWNNK